MSIGTLIQKQKLNIGASLISFVSLFILYHKNKYKQGKSKNKQGKSKNKDKKNNGNKKNNDDKKNNGDKNNNDENTEDSIYTESITPNSKEILLATKVFSHEMKKLSKQIAKLSTKDTNNIKNLFNKDIITTKLLVDSKSITHDDSFNTSNYVVRFGDTNYPNKYDNVIGFRLIKCSIPITPYHVGPGNDLIVFSYVVSGSTTNSSINLSQTSYTGNTLGAELKAKIDAIFTANGVTSEGINVSFDSSTFKYTISLESVDSDNTVQSLTIKWGRSEALNKAFGFNQIDTVITAGNSVISPNAADFMRNFVDLVIDEIPLIACKDNSKGQHVIDRIPFIQDSADKSITYYEAPEKEYDIKNYFYPMNLSQLTIQLFQDTEESIIYPSENGENDFEFELTILQNTRYLN